jgi:hypothetical protein
VTKQSRLRQRVRVSEIGILGSWDGRAAGVRWTARLGMVGVGLFGLGGGGG